MSYGQTMNAVDTYKLQAFLDGARFAGKRLTELFPAYSFDRSFFAQAASWEDAAAMKAEAPADPDECQGFLWALGYLSGR